MRWPSRVFNPPTNTPSSNYRNVQDEEIRVLSMQSKYYLADIRVTKFDREVRRTRAFPIVTVKLVSLSS